MKGHIKGMQGASGAKGERKTQAASSDGACWRPRLWYIAPYPRTMEQLRTIALVSGATKVNENGGATMDTNIASPPRNVAPRLASNRSSDATKQTLDADLIRRIVAGNKLAMQLLYMRHNVRLFRFALRFTRNKATAEDLVQEVFLDVWRKADEFKGRSEVSTWLLAIVRNKALTVMRHRSADQLDEDAAACIADSADTPEMATQKEQARSITCKCLTQLSPAHREIIDLVYYHGKSIEDVSKIIGIPGNTVKTRMFYARKHLAELLCRQGITTAMA
jgi:RNA polymerase sigma-70 factor, ECF subfamily